MVLADADSDGRRKVTPLDNEFEYIDIDSIISAIGEKVDKQVLINNGLLLPDDRYIRFNKETNETILENVFIGGDALRGPSTVIESIADGRKAADAIVYKEKGNIIKDELPPSIIENRINNAITRKGVVSEHIENNSGCLNCNILCTKCVDVCPNRANQAIKTAGGSFRNEYQILHLDSLCNECGNCETFCPHNGKPYKDKITAFYSKEEFKDSNNSGFYFKESKHSGNEIVIILRLNNNIYEIGFDEGCNPKFFPETIDYKYIEFIKTCLTDYSYML